MIYVTGDTHVPIDIEKLSNYKFPEQESLSKDDFLIVCGDFGGVWDGSQSEMEWRKWFDEKPFTTLFVDGNHENFDLLKKFKKENWNGGKIQRISRSIFRLNRGQVFTINGLKFFTMGGASSIDKGTRREGVNWWKEEIPSRKEFDEALDNLTAHQWEVDYVITHTAPTSLTQDFALFQENNPLLSFLAMIKTDLVYKHWFFGHFHIDKDIDKYHSIVFQRILPLNVSAN